jgi:hypothetical protein
MKKILALLAFLYGVAHPVPFPVRTFLKGSSLSADLAAMGSRPFEYDICDTVTLTSDVTIPSNIAIKIIKNGYITGAHVFAFNANLEAGPYQIFNSNVTVTSSTQKTWFAKWFSTLALACTALQTGQNLYLHDGDYMVAASINLSGRSFIAIEGETLKGVRIIPSTTISGGIFSFTNIEATTQREVYLRRLTFLSSNAVGYGIADYAIYAQWTPEFYIEECHFVNVSRIWSVYFNTTFVATIKNCNGIGKVGFSAWGSPAPNALSDGGGFYAENTSTTIFMYTCRWQYYPNVAVRLVSVDAALLDNNALESNGTAGVEIDGGSEDITLQNNYFEGQNASSVADVRFTGTSYATLLQNNFFHGSDNGVSFDNGVEVNSCKIRNNTFYSGNFGIIDRGAKLKGLLIDGNHFRDMSTTLALQSDSTDSIESNRRISSLDNQFSNSPSIPSDQKDLTDGSPVSSWTPIGGTTITGSALRYQNDSLWKIYATGLNYATKTYFSISNTSNPDLRGQWVTVMIPVHGSTGPEARIYDGVRNKGFLLSTSSSGCHQNYLYRLLDASATELTVRIVPAGDSVWVGRPTVRLGLWGDFNGTPAPYTQFVNPSAHVGLSAVNGSSTFPMRADAAPALDQGISPDWTSDHSFEKRIAFSGFGTSTTGSIVRTSADGLILRGVGGSSNDLVLLAADSSNALAVAKTTGNITMSKKTTMADSLQLNTSVTFSKAATPPAPSSNGPARSYFVGDTLTLQYNDGGTVRYKWLKLGGTDSTWHQGTTAP